MGRSYMQGFTRTGILHRPDTTKSGVAENSVHESCDLHIVHTLGGATDDEYTMLRFNAMAVVTLLFLLSYSAWLVHAQDEPTQCPPVAGQPGCVCQHPDGIIDLTKIANCHGKPRYRRRY